MTHTKNKNSIKKKSVKKLTDNQFGVILEDINGKFDVLVEGQKVLFEKVDKLETGQEVLFEKFDKVETGLDRVENKLDAVENRLGGVEDKLDGVESDVSEIKHKLCQKVDVEDFQKLEKRVVKLERQKTAK